MDSTTNSQPPSCLRGKSGRQPGGQQGHKGSTLQRTEQPNQIQDHWPQ